MTDDEVYETAKQHPVASIILDALHTQDARTYNGNAGSPLTLALDTAEAVEKVIRADERLRRVTPVEPVVRNHYLDRNSDAFTELAATIADEALSDKVELDADYLRKQARRVVTFIVEDDEMRALVKTLIAEVERD